MYTFFKSFRRQIGMIHTTLIMLILCSCNKYLDEKPNKTLSVPSTLKDMQLLLDNNGTMNNACPSAVEMAADNFYLSDKSWNAMTNLVARNNYIWDKNAANNTDWSGCYRAVAIANLVLDAIEKQGVNQLSDPGWKAAKGSALFHRSYAFFQAAQLFAPVYNSATANTDQGIPLRLEPDVVPKSTRASVQQTYDRVIGDLQEAASLLPDEVLFKTQPNKAAAYAQLARCYLAMEKYPEALQAAERTLSIYNKLMDYNTMNAGATNPFTRFNDEVIFHSRITSGSSLTASVCIVDTVLYASYTSSDIRKSIFFRNNSDGTKTFKGNYDGQISGALFNGLTTSEIYLIKAESAIRTGQLEKGLEALNKLLENRMKKTGFVPISTGDSEEALRIVLNERRKEMIFRGQRWSDIRRLNKDTRFSLTLLRKPNGELYKLEPGDPRYVFLFPLNVVELSGMPQNPR